MIEPMKAAVRPRVVVGGDRGVMLLEDLVVEVANSGLVKAIDLVASPGFGTTTALEHVAWTLGTRADIQYVDSQPASGFLRSKVTGAILFPRATQRTDSVALELPLARWARDEWIEYLLATHKSQCASIMTRVLRDGGFDSMDGNPSILKLVLDELATDESLPDAKSAVEQIVNRAFSDESIQQDVREIVRVSWPLIAQLPFSVRGEELDLRKIFEEEASQANKRLTDEQLRLLGIRQIRFHFAIESAWQDLLAEIPKTYFCQRLHRSMIDRLAVRITGSPKSQETLRKWVQSDDRSAQSMSVSLLHAAGVEWELPWSFATSRRSYPNRLDRAVLDGADLSGKRLRSVSLQGASLQQANLANADLTHVNAKDADFGRSDLRNTNLREFVALSANLVGVNLTGAIGEDSTFENADLSRADFSNATLELADFSQAKLRKTVFRHAMLKRCRFRNCDLNGANFSRCRIVKSNLSKLDLTVANFTRASFYGSSLNRCNLEGIELPRGDFRNASLKQAVMTGSVIPRGRFNGATLRFAKLAEVDWEFADLRDADLSCATFHMGSSRSGLVPSSIPSEGTRTGYYTDELHEQDFKPPEEIRKANLCFADLRGANIFGVDFYLVDLRGAKYDAKQADQLRRTGAILVSPEC